MIKFFTIRQHKFRQFLQLGFLTVIALMFSEVMFGQTIPVDGMKENTPSVHAFTNATVVHSPGEVTSNATMIIRDGIIESVGDNISIPADARVWDMAGKTIYPGFIDVYSGYGMNNPRVELDRGAMSWNPNIRSHLSASGEFSLEDDGGDALRSQGFTTAHVIPPLGIFKGKTSLLNLNDGPVSDRLLLDNITQAVTLSGNRDFGFTYPTSDIGVIALIRQTLYDADWYQRAHQAYLSDPGGLDRPEMNSALAALSDAVNGNQPILIEAESDEEILRAFRIAEEFGLNVWVKGNGHEYKLTDVLSGTDAPFILPLSYSEKPDIETPEDALDEDLSDLRHYYLAPENPARLAGAGVNFSFTTNGLENPKDFLKQLRLAIDAGLSDEVALAALTIRPAEVLGVDETLGTLESGKNANFVIATGDLFRQNAEILDVWVDGNRFKIDAEEQVNTRGEWQISSADHSVEATLTIEENRPGQLGGTISVEGSEIDLTSVSVLDGAKRIHVDFPGESLDLPGVVRLSASVTENSIDGWAEVPSMGNVQFSGSKVTDVEKENDIERTPKSRNISLTNIRPAMEFGRESIPEQPGIVFVQGATVWTMGPEGIIENGDVIIRDGSVEEVGQNLRVPRNAVVINAEGKHVTPGLIDAHIHSGVNGVNEVGNAITAEVRIGDVLNINNIWMYRQLAGGLTAAHVMHGSANPIGGQNQHIKMRWGALSDDLKIEGAPKTVKFALGENPKRVGSDRYPNTRMGTEQIIADRFSMARDYEARWDEWEATGEGIPPRKDLRLDALADILNGDIIIQSHSYRQDEILMLMRLAEDYGFKIGAFHHGVEAYKVAPELAEHGAGAVVWSDWSSFKIEAYDGILYNAKLLTEAGVLTSLHSDNSQIASRMNWEAAKMVRAGMEPEDALSLVTINTAKVLGIDDKVGSLEPGKDADFVIWSGDPLSTFTKAEQTWIDGRKYFDLDEDAQMKEKIAEERAALIQWIMEDGNE